MATTTGQPIQFLRTQNSQSLLAELCNTGSSTSQKYSDNTIIFLEDTNLIFMNNKFYGGQTGPNLFLNSDFSNGIQNWDYFKNTGKSSSDVFITNSNTLALGFSAAANICLWSTSYYNVEPGDIFRFCGYLSMTRNGASNSELDYCYWHSESGSSTMMNATQFINGRPHITGGSNPLYVEFYFIHNTTTTLTNVSFALGATNCVSLQARQLSLTKIGNKHKSWQPAYQDLEQNWTEYTGQ